MINVIPKPQRIDYRDDSLRLTRYTDVYAEEKYAVYAERLNYILRNIFTNFSGKTIIRENNNAVDDAVCLIVDNTIAKEGYRIIAKDNSLAIYAAGDSGFIYAIETLKQIFDMPATRDGEITVNGFLIEDYPDYSWRGFMLDEARHFFGIAEVKRIIDLLCFNKINKLHWHLTDDQGFRVESKAYPLLHKIGSVRNDTQIGGWSSRRFQGAEHKGYYTQAEIKDIVAYAALRNVEIVPELDIPSHTQAIIASYPQLSCSKRKDAVATTFGKIDSMLCASDENIYIFINNLLEEWAELFPSEYVHLGGDIKCLYKWGECPDCALYMETHDMSAREMLGEFYNKIADFLSKSGKKAIIRDAAYSSNLNPDIIIQAFSAENAGFLTQAAIEGREIIVSPANALYFDYPYAITPLNKTYEFTPHLKEFKHIAYFDEKQILGGECALWSEWIYDREKIDFNLFPRIPAFADNVWNKEEGKDIKDFYKRFTAISSIYKRERVNYAKREILSSSKLRKMRDGYLYMKSDQYSEVRRNRKYKEN